RGVAPAGARVPEKAPEIAYATAPSPAGQLPCGRGNGARSSRTAPCWGIDDETPVCARRRPGARGLRPTDRPAAGRNGPASGTAADGDAAATRPATPGR